MKYSIVEYPISEELLLSGVISQNNSTARLNNFKTKCIISYNDTFVQALRKYPKLTLDELKEYMARLPKEWDLEYIQSNEVIDVQSSPAFADKYLMVDGVKKSLFKRVHGLNLIIAAGQTGFLEFTIPYSACKFSGAKILGCDLKDTLDFFILDTGTNTYSNFPIVNGVGGNFMLNQFGFNVEMPSGGSYENTSNYDANLYYNMVVVCAYKNNSNTDKYIAMNLWLHEVK